MRPARNTPPAMKIKAQPNAPKFKPTTKIKPTLCKHTTESRFSLITTEGNGVMCVLCNTTWSPDQ